MRILSLGLLAVFLVGCSSGPTSVATHELPAKLYKNVAELGGQSYSELGDVSGSSCQMSRQDPPPSISEARQDMLIRASRMKANSVILDDCEMMDNVPGCYRQAVCRGSAISVSDQ